MTDPVTHNKNQEAFNKMVAHLKQMNGRAIGITGNCMYLSDNGDRCAVGALLTEEEARKAPIATAAFLVCRPEEFPSLKGLNGSMLEEVQELHDRAACWENRKFVAWGELREVAKEFNLDPSVISKG